MFSETDPQFICSHDGEWHEAGCPHKDWENDELIEALDNMKLMYQVVRNKLTLQENSNIQKDHQ